MTEFIFVVWFINEECEEFDQDREWNACFAIIGDSQHSCLNWGVKLSEEYANENQLKILSMELKTIEEYGEISEEYMPKVIVGDLNSNEIIGW